ncbi:MAG: hypothetical protein HY786_07940 [Deltaproteobacteria bacterium]|nr:hypothetical protein [Deltaproteobacteria bacterium]
MILRFMKVSFKCRNVKYLICPAVLFAGTFLFVPHTWAASCCGGGGAAGLILPKFSKAMVDVSVSMEKYDGYWDKKGVYSKDPPHSDLRQYRLNLGYGHRLASRWQGSISIPYVWNENKYPAIESRTDGVGDAAVSLLYEAFDNVQCVWKVRNLEDLRPAASFALALTAPTGISLYDNGLFPTKTAKESYDITGRGFYRLDGNMLMEKTIFPWTASILLSYGTHLERTVESEYGKPILKPYHKRLGDRAIGTLSLAFRPVMSTQ